jgi:hypothetical protein
MNLYLYIPPNSAHPEGLLRGLIFGRLRAYWYQNTKRRNFVKMAQHLANRLVARRYSKKVLTPLFIEATERLRLLESESAVLGGTIAGSVDKEKEDNPIYFHLPFHPRGIQRPTIRKLFNATLKKASPQRRLIVAASRQKNLGDRVCHTRLPDVPGNNPSDFF